MRIDIGEIDDYMFVNTASLGGYALMIDARERLRGRIGRWPAHFMGALESLREGLPMAITLNGRERRIWMIYIGNCRHEPPGFAPAWRPRLDDGLLDVRIAHAEVRWSRVRLLMSLLAGRLPSCRAYEQLYERRLEIEAPAQRVRITRDGDTFDASARFAAGKRDRVLPVYTPRPPA